MLTGCYHNGENRAEIVSKEIPLSSCWSDLAIGSGEQWRNSPVVCGLISRLVSSHQNWLCELCSCVISVRDVRRPTFSIRHNCRYTLSWKSLSWVRNTVACAGDRRPSEMGFGIDHGMRKTMHPFNGLHTRCQSLLSSVCPSKYTGASEFFTRQGEKSSGQRTLFARRCKTQGMSDVQRCLLL